MIKVKDLMQRKVHTVDVNASAYSIAKLMAKTRIGCAIVLKKGKPVGIVTDSDIIERVVAKNKQAKKIKAKDIMSSPLITVSPEDSIVDASRKLRKNVIKRLPVVKNGKLVGIITNTDISSVTPEFLNILEERMKMKESGEEPVRTEETTIGICEGCGNYSDDLKYVNGQWLCPTCREEAEEES